MKNLSDNNNSRSVQQLVQSYNLYLSYVILNYSVKSCAVLHTDYTLANAGGVCWQIKASGSANIIGPWFF